MKQHRDAAEMPNASSIDDGPGVGRKVSKTRVMKFGSVLDMSPYMDRRFFGPAYTPSPLPGRPLLYEYVGAVWPNLFAVTVLLRIVRVH